MKAARLRLALFVAFALAALALELALPARGPDSVVRPDPFLRVDDDDARLVD